MIYVVMPKAFADANNGAKNGVNTLSIIQTSDGRYVSNINTLNDFPAVFNGTNFPQVSLSETNFPQFDVNAYLSTVLIKSNYTTSIVNNVVLVDASNGPINITLAPVLNNEVVIKKIDNTNNNVTVVGVVDGGTNYVISQANSGCTFSFLGGKFYITGVI